MKSARTEFRNSNEISIPKSPYRAGVPCNARVSRCRLKAAIRFPVRRSNHEPVFGVRSSVGFPSSDSGFTLIEVLVVIAIIAVLAGLAMPVYNWVSTKSIIQRAQSEEKVLETAIDNYHSKYGFYPPGNPGAGADPSLALTNQLYYELVGTTYANGNFTTLDNASTVSTNALLATFGVAGIMNCTKGSGDDAVEAQSFLTGKFGQIATNLDGVAVIATGASSDPIYNPMLGFSVPVGKANPWRYRYPGVNNPSSYDLWVQIYVAGKTNLICNWKDQIQYNSPLP